MPETIASLSPEPLWRHFASLCAVPRPSRHEQGVARLLRDFAARHGLRTASDAAGNMAFWKPAAPGREAGVPVILQAHMDMVPQKRAGLDFDFERDPVRPVRDGAWVRAEGTTLGADNGIGLAAILAALESRSIPHGPLRALVTVEEEVGLRGARALDPALVDGEAMINLDSSVEGEVTVGCAGGADLDGRMDAEAAPAPEGLAWRRVLVRGLRGGHSGGDIHKGHANSHKLLARFLRSRMEAAPLALASFSGGGPRNAIPRETEAVVGLPAGGAAAFAAAASQFAETVRRELAAADPGVLVSVEEASAPAAVLADGAARALLRAVHGCPNGVLGLSAAFPGTVETSSNLARVEARAGSASFESHQRSLADSLRDDAAAMVSAAFEAAGFSPRVHDAYPAWTPDPGSPLLATMKAVRRSLFGEEPPARVFHAGLECGVVGKLRPGLQMASIGATITGMHSPDERVEVASVDRFWRYLVGILSVL